MKGSFDPIINTWIKVFMISSEAKEITTIVVNWNLPDETARCLDSLQSARTPCRVLLVDNGSLDGSGFALKERFPKIEVLSLPQNVGFGRACNLAIQEALLAQDCRYIFLLNNDASVGKDTLAQLQQTAQAQPAAGILGPKIYQRHPADKIWYAGARRRQGVLAAKTFGRGQFDHGQFEHLQAVDYVFGAAMFIRRGVFERIGLFDERYFLYLEDLDFCLRAQQAGYKLLLVPQAHIWHTVSASTAGDLPRRRYHQIRSTVLFLRKHLARTAIGPAILFWSAVFLRSLCLDLISDGFKALVSYWQALLSGYREHIRQTPAKKQRLSER
ncbi:glycosyltransferase family 2 protein [Chloroflexota bacterium]